MRHASSTSSRAPPRRARPIASTRRRVLVAALGVAVVILGTPACGPPIGATRVGARAVQRSLSESAFSSGHASDWTRNTVNGWGLLERYEKEPAATIAELRDIVTSRRG